MSYYGEQRDYENRYITMGARIYDPDLGQFLSVDPLADIFAFSSPCVYANNSPMKHNNSVIDMLHTDLEVTEFDKRSADKSCKFLIVYNFNDPSGLAPEKDYGERWLYAETLDNDVWSLNVKMFDIAFANMINDIYEIGINVPALTPFSDNTGRASRESQQKTGENGYVNWKVMEFNDPYGIFKGSIYFITFSDKSNKSEKSVELLSIGGLVWGDHSKIADAFAKTLASIIYKMGGVGIWNEMTDISGFLIVDDARSISNEGTRNAFHRWDDKVIVMEARFLKSDAAQPVYKDDGTYELMSKGLQTLAHEIGHNVHYKWYYENAAGKEFMGRFWSKGIAPLTLENADYRTILEGAANYFSNQINIRQDGRYDIFGRFNSPEYTDYNMIGYGNYIRKTIRRKK
jgi:RHS repeat-associated protein